ncbi:hypothetical protein MY04_3851 [Flammeovirga sp. MY04]|uniref:hypothetical protein n=1 Tax=Flammeovirga sp. MY04 TaxID=1191459 RepID=UPI001305362A|nr:hypothetical protein [Flammeovirga sp. MY04]ANQ51195.2 hypothetical protein MY04_3851 [Flammeovirga sp. MY04]
MKLLIHISLILLPFYSFSQGLYDIMVINYEQEGYPCNLDSLDGEPVYDIVEAPASFEGGMRSFYKIIGQTLTFPDEMKQRGAVKFYFSFIIDKNGEVRNLCCSESITEESIKEFIKLMKGKWIPGKQNNKKVHQKMVLASSVKFG